MEYCECGHSAYAHKITGECAIPSCACMEFLEEPKAMEPEYLAVPTQR